MFGAMDVIFAVMHRLIPRNTLRSSVLVYLHSKPHKVSSSGTILDEE